jgi:hypothetical protein
MKPEKQQPTQRSYVLSKRFERRERVDEGSVIYDTMDHRYLQEEDIVKLLNVLDTSRNIDRVLKEDI